MPGDPREDRLTEEAEELTARGQPAAAADRAELIASLQELVADVGGSWSSFEAGIRESIGNTNYAVVAEKLDGCRKLLARMSR